MSDTVIKVENISKRYTIKHQQERYTALRDVVMNNSKNIIKKAIGRTVNTNSKEDFWALNDVSFEINRGDRIGIIGRNGAGKSTLLKILSRITEPTKGRITINGRVASLLEVGTGFHPELTGRENIYLNGAILGMRKSEIKSKFDQIVDFSGVEKFLDTPVKRYSSGMYVRLAFAVAAHLETEILVVDEVLAVGDAEFQKKCLGKMEEVSKGSGKTVLLVSHNMMAIRQLCSRCILLKNGRIEMDNDSSSVIQHYHSNIKNISINKNTAIGDDKYRRGDGAIRFTSVEICNVDNNICNEFKMGEMINFKISYQIFQQMKGVKLYIALKNIGTGEIITSIEHIISNKTIESSDLAEYEVLVTIPPNLILRPGEYPLYFHLSDAAGSPFTIDVLDDLTSPIIIKNEAIGFLNNFNIEKPFGYFSIPSEVNFKQ
jgi:lipopolysaccharide transport system ATP-binding protein